MIFGKTKNFCEEKGYKSRFSVFRHFPPDFLKENISCPFHAVNMLTSKILIAFKMPNTQM